MRGQSRSDYTWRWVLDMKDDSKEYSAFLSVPNESRSPGTGREQDRQASARFEVFASVPLEFMSP
jgi:hypothetical protein